LLALTAPPAAQSSTPNIVLILVDDLGYGDVGAFNPQGRIPTPHLDRLTREGVRFTDAHTPSAVCTATRYGLLTGRYPWRTRLTRGVVRGNGDALIEPGRATLGLWSPKPDL
jgi:arylsulfatase A-like enzyme